MNTLCESEVLPHKVSDNPDMAHIEEGIKIKPVNIGLFLRIFQSRSRHVLLTPVAELEEDGVRIALTIVDTPGFGDNIDNEFAYAFFVTLFRNRAGIDTLFTASKRSLVTSRGNTTTFSLKSRASSVTRVSVIIVYTRSFTLFPRLDMRELTPLLLSYYSDFSSPWSLREMDIELMRRLSPRVNVIPVIGKADSLTPSELKGFKKRARTHRCIFRRHFDRTFLDHGRHRTL